MTKAAMATVVASTSEARPGIDWQVVLVAVLTLIAGVAVLAAEFGARHAALLPLGVALGATLYHAAFGFTGGWRAFVVQRHGASVRAQLLMLAIATVLFFPLLAEGSAFGQPLAAAVAPVGISVLVGAFLFGLGMQLGGGCGSGTLFTIGGGSVRMLVTLLFFVVGAVVGTAHLPAWLALPSISSVSIGSALGVGPGIAAQLTALAVLAWLSIVLERRRHGRLVAAGPAPEHGWRRVLRGPWPLVWGAVLLAALNALTLVVAGHPWSITFAFGLWGAKALVALGIDVAAWEFWTWPRPAAALAGSVLADTTSVMNFGLVVGALGAAGLAGRFGSDARLPLASLLAAVIGGLLMGYGARLAFGCNIGALFSGIASGSLHGWLWLAAGFAGTVVGVRLRPLFGLTNS